MEKLRKASVLE